LTRPRSGKSQATEGTGRGTTAGPGPRKQIVAKKPGRMLRVIGVDPGSASTGYGVVDSDGRHHRLVEYAAIRAPARCTFAERLFVISEKLEEVVERLKPDACAVEETFYAVNVKSALKLGHVRGVALVAAARAGVPVFEYSPLEVKLALVGYGRAEKHQVQEMVRLILSLREPPKPLDASDALGVAICHINTYYTGVRGRQPGAEVSGQSGARRR
jgi:crossover junction endodeoxyribonuclease RuvC